MVLALSWNDTKSFKQHLEHMRMFRQSHNREMEDEIALLKDMPTPQITCLPCKAGGFTSISIESTLVPMWEIVLSQSSQN